MANNATPNVESQAQRRPYVYELEARSELVQRILQVLRRLEPRQRSLDREVANPLIRNAEAQELQKRGWEILMELDRYAEAVYAHFNLDYKRPPALQSLIELLNPSKAVSNPSLPAQEGEAE